MRATARRGALCPPKSSRAPRKPSRPVAASTTVVPSFITANRPIMPASGSQTNSIGDETSQKTCPALKRIWCRCVLKKLSSSTGRAARMLLLPKDSPPFGKIFDMALHSRLRCGGGRDALKRGANGGWAKAAHRGFRPHSAAFRIGSAVGGELVLATDHRCQHRP